MGEWIVKPDLLVGNWAYVRDGMPACGERRRKNETAATQRLVYAHVCVCPTVKRDLTGRFFVGRLKQFGLCPLTRVCAFLRSFACLLVGPSID